MISFDSTALIAVGVISIVIIAVGIGVTALIAAVARRMRKD